MGSILRSTDQGKTWSETKLTFKVGGNMPGRGTGEVRVKASLYSVLTLCRGWRWTRILTVSCILELGVAMVSGRVLIMVLLGQMLQPLSGQVSISLAC
jgi:hypothetical protein